jgi:hypothetical protein
VVAENTRICISANTKAALAAANERYQLLGAYRDGVFVGRICTAEDCAKATAARTAKAQARAGHVAFALKHIDPDGTMSLAALARRPNEERVPTPSGKGQWAEMTVKRLRARLASA